MNGDATSDDLIREAKAWAPEGTASTDPNATSHPSLPVDAAVRPAPSYPADLIDRPTDPELSPADSPQPASSSGSKAWVAFAIAVVGVVGAGVLIYQQLTEADTDHIFALPPGACFIEPQEPSVAAVETVECTAVHDLEVFATVTLPFGPAEALPDDETLWGAAWDHCLPFFETYTGESYDQSAWWLDAYVPDRHGWKAGDRDAVCVLYLGDSDGMPLPADNSARV